jgi:hypothetical protein
MVYFPTTQIIQFEGTFAEGCLTHPTPQSRTAMNDKCFSFVLLACHTVIFKGLWFGGSHRESVGVVQYTAICRWFIYSIRTVLAADPSQKANTIMPCSQ